MTVHGEGWMVHLEMMETNGATIGCKCGLCVLRRQATMWGEGGWCDPRRGYSEREGDFLARVPDGFLVWPAEHIGLNEAYEMRVGLNEAYEMRGEG